MASNSKENFPPLSDRRYLQVRTNEHAHRVPLGLRRSVSLEDLYKQTCYNLLKKRPIEYECDISLSSSINNLCVQFRPHQLLPEFNPTIAQISREHEFDWWKSISHIRPILEKIILDEKLTNEFNDDPENNDEHILTQFRQSKRNQRRNAICLIVDRLYYNEQTILFSSIASDLQIEYNLISSGFRM